MSSRRYYITILPIEHINGKMSQAAYKVANVPAGGIADDNEYWYGYRLHNIPRSYYGIRKKHRLLADNPYTTAEEENRTLFSLALQSVNTHRQIAGDWALCLEDFNGQRKYTTANGYAVATCRANNGDWPPYWIS